MKAAPHFFSQRFFLSVRVFLRKAEGVLNIALAVFLLLSLSSSWFLDCSLNTATANVPRNWLGNIGASTSDMFFQMFGFFSYGFVVAFFIHGFHILTFNQRLLSIKRLLALVMAITFFCIGGQGLFVDQISAAHDFPPLHPACGSLGWLLSRKFYLFMQKQGYVRFFFLCSLGWFLLGIVFWKIATHTTFRQIGRLFVTIVLFGKKLFQKIRGLSKVDTSVDLSVFPEEKVSQDEVLTDAVPVEEKSLPKRKKIPQSRLEQERDLFHSGGYQKPSPDLLAQNKEDSGVNMSKDNLQTSAQTLLKILNEFGVEGDILNVQPGPIVTMYEFRPAPGIKTSRVISLADDISRSMSALSARIATIPGKNAIGIELPNPKRQTVFLRPILQSNTYKQMNSGLPLVLGKDIAGGYVIADLTKMPHLLVAGTTGSGKSVSINTMILSLLFKFTPEQCRFIMVDPKMLELSVYNDIPHLLTPVVTEPKKAVFALKWAVNEMEQRYKALSRLGVRNIENFNQKIQQAKQKGDVFHQRIQTGFDMETGKPIFEDQPLDYQELPYIVVVVDEMADLMLVAGKEIESAVQRLAQMARAAGIHLIMATQRPSVDVITGTIKANFPTRISFQVTSKIDSRTILGEQGAEQLLGHGDMLYMSGGGRLQRVHGPFVSDEDVEEVVRFLRSQAEPHYIDGVTDEIEGTEFDQQDSGNQDDLYQQAVAFVQQEGRVSISSIQRKFQIGYNKSAGIVERMEKAGLVSAPDRNGKRNLL